MKKLIVYFDNNNKAVFDVDGTVFVTEHPRDDKIVSDALDGLSVINWANVCFVRTFEEREPEE